MKKNIFFSAIAVAFTMTVLMCACTGNNPSTIVTDNYVVTIEKGSIKNANYHPTIDGNTICFENGLAYIATRMLEENIDNGADDVMIFIVGENRPIYKICVQFSQPQAIYDYTDVVRSLASYGWIKMDTTMVDAYMLTVVDSTKKEPGKSDWAGSYSIRKCCGIAAKDAEGFDYKEWNVPMKALREDMDIHTLNEYLATKGLALIPTEEQIMKVAISPLK